MSRSVRSAFALAVCLAGTLSAQSTELPTPYGPDWADAVPKRVIRLEHDPAESDQENGEILRLAIRSLVAGDRLEIGAGTWSVRKYFNASLQGTRDDPIFVVAAPGARPVITRPDPFTSVIHIGMPNEPSADFLAIRGLEITGGAMGMRLGMCTEVWIDRCEIHHTASAGLTANSRNTSHLYITRNEIHHTDGIGEGMYLGGNNSQYVMHSSVIAQNWVHDTGGWQGDGIEVKQGSWGNLIADNLVHDTRYPCLITYGTDGNPPNVIERNVLYGSLDNVLQVQGEAIVRNNLILCGKNGFHSHDHQGSTRDLVFVNNTIINDRRGANLVNWANRPGMVFANNAVYSQTQEAVIFGGLDAGGVTISGNVRVGGVFPPKSGFVEGVGLSDFVNVTWTGTRRRAQPSAGSVLLVSADPAHAVGDDLNRKERATQTVAGAFDPLSFGLNYGSGVSGLGGVTPRIGVGSPRDLGNLGFAIELEGGAPLTPAILTLGLSVDEIPLGGGVFYNDITFAFLERTDAAGKASFPIPIQNNPVLVGIPFYAQWSVWDRHAQGNWSFTPGLRLIIEAP